MDWVVWIVVILGVLFWAAGRDPAHGPRPPVSRTPEPGGPSPADSRPAPPPARTDRGEDRFADGAVFGYLAAQHWLGDDDGDGADGLWSDDDPDVDADGGHDADEWDGFDDGFGDFDY